MNWRGTRGRLDRLEAEQAAAPDPADPYPGLWDVTSGRAPLEEAHPATRRLVESMLRPLGQPDDGPDHFERLMEEKLRAQLLAAGRDAGQVEEPIANARPPEGP